jgi:hypothetical protein
MKGWTAQFTDLAAQTAAIAAGVMVILALSAGRGETQHAETPIHHQGCTVCAKIAGRNAESDANPAQSARTVEPGRADPGSRLAW